MPLQPNPFGNSENIGGVTYSSDPTGMPEVGVTGGISSTTNSNPQSIDWSSLDSQYGSPAMSGIGVDPVNLGSSESSSLSGLAGDVLSAGSGLSSILNGLGINSSNLGALAPELGVAGVGLAQAKSAQSDAAKQAQSIQGPSQNLINQGNNLLSQYNNQKLTPMQQQFVDFTSQEGQDLINSGSGLKAIAQQAFGNYASGQLPQADEIQLRQSVASQKQQIASQLGQSGMQDSSVLDAYNQQIDNQAMVTRQQMLDQRFQTGVTAYNSWLNSTTQGIQVKQAGAQFAQSAFQDMMNNGLQLESQGMAGLTQAIALTIQSDNQLSQSVSQLMGNLAAAYAYTVSGPAARGGGGGGGMGGSGGGGGGGGLLNQLTGYARTGNSLYNDFSSFGGMDTSGAFTDMSSGLDTSTLASESGVANDIASSNLDWLGGTGFNAAGGAAAESGALTPSVLGDYSFAPALSNVGTGAVGAAADSAQASVTAATSAGEAGSAGASAAGMSAAQIGGAIAAPLSIYNEVNSWQSGKTGQDALGGASSGAAVGTAIMPGFGTAIGAVVGAAAGAISSLFGNGAVDPENAPFNSYTQAYNKASPQMKPQVAAAVKNPYIALAGYFDLRSNQLKGQNPIYQAYGRRGEQKFTNDLVSKVNQAKLSGMKDPTQVWNQVVQPWLNSFGTWNDSNKSAMTALMQNMTGQIFAGTYQQNFRAVGGDTPFTTTSTAASVNSGQSTFGIPGKQASRRLQ